MNKELQAKILRIAFDLRHVCESENRHLSFFLDKTRIISIGFNSNFKYSKITRGFGYFDGSRHSEIDCYLRLKNKSLMPYLTLVNVRLSKNAVIGMSQPCDKCRKFLSKTGYKKIIYTDRDGSFKEL